MFGFAGLTASGLTTDQFHFIGFLPHKSGQRRNALQSLQDLEGTLEFFPLQTGNGKLHQGGSLGIGHRGGGELDVPAQRGELLLIAEGPVPHQNDLLASRLALQGVVHDGR